MPDLKDGETAEVKGSARLADTAVKKALQAAEVAHGKS